MSTGGKTPKRKTKPFKPIDWKRVEELLVAGCTGMEIAANFNIHHDIFYGRVQKEYGILFTELAQEKMCLGNSILRAVQFDEAVRKRNKVMLIWLGKNRLGQSDKDEIQHKGSVPISVTNYSDRHIKPWEDDYKGSQKKEEE